MRDHSLTTDYLIVGCGAVGMAFADTLLTDTDADIVIIDRHHQPGGHWNVAYPFVTLHQPSAFYGVSSAELSDGTVDRQGLNKGLSSLASGAAVSAYFDNVMKRRFLPSGRVRYFPMCDYLGDGEFRSLLTGDVRRVSATRKRVDATYLKTSVPATHVPGFRIEDGVRFVPPNDLVMLDEHPDGYVVVGGGKTGIDTCLWLLENGVDPGAIRWVMPRDAWLLDRRNTQASVEFFNDTIGAQAAQYDAIARSDSIDDMFARLESAGVLVRIDTAVKPRMFHGATISQAELVELRRIRNVIRLGRVRSLARDRIVLDDGSVATTPGTLHVDCSASAITNLATRPIFEGDLITPQTVRSYQPVFSASLIAHVEATRDTEAEKNRLCGVVPLPNRDTDWIRMMVPNMANQYQWSRDPELRTWLVNNRLDGFSHMVNNAAPDDVEKQAILGRLRDNAAPAMAKLQKFLGDLGNGR